MRRLTASLKLAVTSARASPHRCVTIGLDIGAKFVELDRTSYTKRTLPFINNACEGHELFSTVQSVRKTGTVKRSTRARNYLDIPGESVRVVESKKWSFGWGKCGKRRDSTQRILTEMQMTISTGLQTRCAVPLR